MEFDSVVRKRKSTRSFKSKKPSWKNIIEAIDLALEGPFAGNNNNLKFLIIEEKKSIKAIAKNSEQKWIESAPLLILVLSDDTHLENMYRERGRVYSRQQAGAAIQTILLKLTDLGISSCWVGAYTDELIKQKLEIPQHVQIEGFIATGYESEKEAKPQKKELETVLKWENWNQTRKPKSSQESIKENLRPNKIEKE